jgi:ketosteroid isomerase-like protein
MKLFTLVLVGLVWIAPAQAQSSPPATSPLPSVVLPPALDRVLRDYERAWQAHDATALSELFAVDGFVLENGHLPVRGRTAVKAAYTGAGGPLSLRALAYATAGDIGYIIGEYGPAPAAPDSGKFVLTLKRQGRGPWLIMSDMDNPNQRPSQSLPAAANTSTQPVGATSPH